MPFEVLTDSLPYLAVLISLLVSAMLTVLAAHRRCEIALHDRVRQAKLLRQDYCESVEQTTTVQAEPRTSVSGRQLFGRKATTP